MKDVIFKYLKEQEKKTKNCYNLIASESLASKESLKALGSFINYKYAEGFPGKRYYCGNKWIDKIELECIERAKKLFKCKLVNVQPINGSGMNLALISFLLKPGDKILSMGSNFGHLSHGSKVNFTGKHYKIFRYDVNENGDIDYKELEKLALKIKPKLIISGYSSYYKKIDFRKIWNVCKGVGCLHISDVSHLCGLIAAGYHQSPINYCDFMTSTFHKTMLGVRGGVIMSNNIKYKDVINRCIFPFFQGGMHPNIIAANAIALKHASTNKFKIHIKKVLENTLYLNNKLEELGFKVSGTQNHLFLVDLSQTRIDGRTFADELEKRNILVNCNLIPNDKRNPWRPSGIRIGLNFETQRGITKKQLDFIANKMLETLKN